jgi:hypothetical protein
VFFHANTQGVYRRPAPRSTSSQQPLCLSSARLSSCGSSSASGHATITSSPASYFHPLIFIHPPPPIYLHLTQPCIMRPATLAFSVASLLLSPRLVACVPLPTPEIGSAYSGAGGQAPGGSTTQGSGLGLLGDGVGLFSHNAGDGGRANSGDATAISYVQFM